MDEYNLLVDILRELVRKATDAGVDKVPGRCYKFLAADIMAHNASWDDDAFCRRVRFMAGRSGSGTGTSRRTSFADGGELLQEEEKNRAMPADSGKMDIST